MIRFVDLREQECSGNKFAFWDTITDKFLMFTDEQAWGSWSEFKESFDIEMAAEPAPSAVQLLVRLCGLTPPWAKD